jgi:hypothetical protein
MWQGGVLEIETEVGEEGRWRMVDEKVGGALGLPVKVKKTMNPLPEPDPEPEEPSVPQRRSIKGFWVKPPAEALEQMLTEEFPESGVTVEYEGSQTYSFTVPDGVEVEGLERKARDVLPATCRVKVRNGA